MIWTMFTNLAIGAVTSGWCVMNTAPVLTVDYFNGAAPPNFGCQEAQNWWVPAAVAQVLHPTPAKTHRSHAFGVLFARHQQSCFKPSAHVCAAFSNTNSVFPNQQYWHQTFYTCWHLATWHQAAPVMGGFHLQHDVNHSNHTSDTL